MTIETPEAFGVSAGGFAIVPYELMDEAPDSSYVLVYLALYRHGHGSLEGCWCSQQRLSEDSGVYLKGVRRALTWLEGAGWVRGKHRNGGTTIYEVITQDPGRKRPRSKTTPVENALGGRSKTTQGGRSKTTYKQDPYKQDPLNKIPKGGREAKTDDPDPFRLKRLPADAVPSDLLGHSDLLLEFWQVKKGTRSRRVFERVCGKLRQWSFEQQQEALERAIASGWGDVFQPRAAQPGVRGCRPDEKSIADLAAEMRAMPSLF
jgi:hypothetical protein